MNKMKGLIQSYLKAPVIEFDVKNKLIIFNT